MKPQKNRSAVHLGRKGGFARAKKLSPARRREIARQAAQARWGRKKGKVGMNKLRMIFLVASILILAACAGPRVAQYDLPAPPAQYVETYDVPAMRIIFTDRTTMIRLVADAIGVDVATAAATIRAATHGELFGFWHNQTRTLYCEKWAFEVCGHELTHAVLGQFHGLPIRYR